MATTECYPRPQYVEPCLKAGFAPTAWVQWHRTFFERDKLIPRRIYSVSGGEDVALDIFKMKPKSLCLVVR
jgi:hypothetical protein